MLMQEKMSHVEELRQIHADINAVSSQILYFNLKTKKTIIVDGDCHKAGRRKPTEISSHG